MVTIFRLTFLSDFSAGEKYANNTQYKVSVNAGSHIIKHDTVSVFDFFVEIASWLNFNDVKETKQEKAH